MPPPSVEAANTALRLDPDILPPLGSVVAYSWGIGTHSVHCVVTEFLISKDTPEVLLGNRRAPRRLPSHKGVEKGVGADRNRKSSMTMPDLEAANVALRLDSELMIPDGSEVSCKWPGGSHRTGWVKGYNIKGILGISPYESCPPNPTIFVSSEVSVEIVRLPDDCPPLSEWKRVSELLERVG